MQATICDVGPRDGLQNEPETLPPSVRADLVSRLAAAGVPRIEAVSFVRDDRVYERFNHTTLDRVNCTLAATDEFNRRNGNASLDEAVARVSAVVQAAA